MRPNIGLILSDPAGSPLLWTGSVRWSSNPIGSGLTLWRIFAHDAFVASQLPGPIRTVLKPLGNAGLGVNLAIHHRNIGLIAGGNIFFQTELTVAK